jgi:alpha-amylase
VQDRVDELSYMGITAMWLPRTHLALSKHLCALTLAFLAPTKAAGQNSVGYDIYDMYDLGEFDQKGGQRTKFGTKEQYLELINKAKAAGIVSYIDAVLNHKFVDTFSIQPIFF